MHSLDTKGEILDVAARLYADLGYSAVSMRDVAREVGVTQANLYHYFKSKDDLIRETLAHAFTQKTAPMIQIFETADSSSERLEAFVGFFVRLLTEDRIFFRLLMRELVDGDSARLKALAQSVLEHPFRLVSSLANPQKPENERFLTTVSIISLMLGHVQLAVLLPYLQGGRPEHADASVITRHVAAVLRRAFQDAAKEQ
jgi:AcrR family transcriptional regulator